MDFYSKYFWLFIKFFNFNNVQAVSFQNITKENIYTGEVILVKEFAKNAFINYNGILYLLYISLFIAFFFITPIFIDKIRIYSFRGIWTFLEMLKQNDRKTTA